MIPVQPEDRVCLLIDIAYLPYAIATARSAFYHILKGHGQGVAPDGTHYSFDDLEKGYVPLAEDTPCMRSANKVWALPTVFKVNESFFFNKKKKNVKGEETVTLRQLYAYYQGVCQICYEHKHFSEFSKEHIFPRHLGGTDDSSNITLTCKRCNNLKGHQYPYHDKFGNPLQGIKIYKTGFFMPDKSLMREDWKPFLFL